MEKTFGRTVTNMALRTLGLRKRPKSLKGFAVSMILHAPSVISSVQSLANTLNWKKAQSDIAQGLETSIILAGLPGTGKHTLLHLFLSSSSTQIDDMHKEYITAPFTIVETEKIMDDRAFRTFHKAGLILYVIDATKEIAEEEKSLIKKLLKERVPIVLVINKIDLVTGKHEEFSMHSKKETGIKLSVGVSALTGEHIADTLFPTMVTLSPSAAIAIGHALPSYRRVMAKRLIRSATMLSCVAALEPIPFIDIPILLGIQTRLVLRLATLYGYPMSTASARTYIKVLVTTMGSSLVMRYTAEEIAKSVPIAGDLVAGMLGGVSTWSIGQATCVFLENAPKFTTSVQKLLSPVDYETIGEHAQ